MEKFNSGSANAQQVLPVQTSWYWYDEWMVQDINNKTLTEVNLVR